MNYKDMVIGNDPIELEKAFELVKSVFDITKEFPNQVFKKQFKTFSFNAFDWMVTADVLATLQQLSKASGDTHVIVGTLEVDPTGSLYKNDPLYWFKVPMTVTKEDYDSLMGYTPQTPDDSAGEFFIIAPIVVWIPLSGKWAMYGERCYEISALSFADARCAIAEELIIDNWWRPIDRALDELVSMIFVHRGSIPQKLTDDFLLNYSNKQ